MCCRANEEMKCTWGDGRRRSEEENEITHEDWKELEYKEGQGASRGQVNKNEPLATWE